MKATIEKFNPDGSVNVRDNDTQELIRCVLELVPDYGSGKRSVKFELTPIETIETGEE